MTTLVDRFWQWYCPHQGKTLTLPIIGERPYSPAVETTYCCDCGKKLWDEFTDNAGTERREF